VRGQALDHPHPHPLPSRERGILGNYFKELWKDAKQ